MLPDFPALKRDFMAEVSRRMQRSQRQGGLLGEIRRTPVHQEGDSLRWILSDGTIDEHPYSELSAESGPIPDAILEDGPLAVMKMAQSLEAEMRQELEKRILSDIAKACSSAGTRVAAEGPMKPEHLLDTFEKMQLDFDAEGKPKCSIVVHPEGMEAAVEAFRQIEEDPELKARFDSIMERQRGNWADRQRDRRLVD